MIPVYYRPEMNAEAQSFSPSAGKPRLVVADWAKHFPDKVEVVSFQPVPRGALALAHDRGYVDQVLDLEDENGFGNRLPSVAASLPYTVGSLVAAAKHVATGDPIYGSRVAVSPTSGFHHAHYDHGHGFCTFNGLIVAAMTLKRLRLVERVGILDLDRHWGDGCVDIIRRLKLDWVYYIHDVTQHACSRLKDLHLKDRCNLVIGQMGADPHIDDPLGGLLTTKEMAERDRCVMFVASAYQIPFVWNLAGGYQTDEKGSIEPVLALHRETMRQCIKHWES